MAEGESLVFEEKNIMKTLLRIAPPVMLAQLIQAMYNIVDSFFIGRYSQDGLTALSVIYPVQLIVTAIAVGTGVGVNTLMSRYYAQQKPQKAEKTAGTGTVLAALSWLVFAVLSALLMGPFARISADSPMAVEYVMSYGSIVCIGSLGVFMESLWTKALQAKGNMRRPMLAQIAGALTNIVLDPLLIFGAGPIPALGIAGAAWATVAGQFVAAGLTAGASRRPPCMADILYFTKKIYALGFPSIFMQALYTVYIMALNMILVGFSDAAVTVLGIYYKIQSFFFIPLSGFETCIVPFISYSFGKKDYARCRDIMAQSSLLAMAFMLIGVLCFEFIPGPMLRMFSDSAEIAAIGVPALRIIGASFVPAVISLLMPVFFQAIGGAIPSVLLSVTRQIFCLIPIFWLLSRLGLAWTWLAFPTAELITGSLGLFLYRRQLRRWQLYRPRKETKGAVKDMKMITAIINRRDAQEVCQALAESGHYFTRMASSGGFLSAGNTTLMIGADADKVPAIIGIIRAHCSVRTESVPTAVQSSASSVAYPAQVTVGGATVFVTDVEQFEKI